MKLAALATLFALRATTVSGRIGIGTFYSAAFERELGGPCDGICTAIENACPDNSGNGKGCAKLCDASSFFGCGCGTTATTTPGTTTPGTTTPAPNVCP